MKPWAALTVAGIVFLVAYWAAVEYYIGDLSADVKIIRDLLDANRS